MSTAPEPARFTDAQIQDRLSKAASHVKVNGAYVHYKGGHYTVTGLAIIEDTGLPAVIYRAEYGGYHSFIRPIANWLETVEVDGKMVQRFQIVS